jgi:uncharacterized surface protein with fasciclin (FAS1) repeats
MKTSKKLVGIALLSATMFVGFNGTAQEKKETKKEMANKVEKKMDEKMSVEKTMMPEAEVKTVGGAKMFPTRNIVENAINSKDHTTLVAAVKAADLVETLTSEGPFTVFAPTNEAFEALPEGTVETLLKAENKEQLQSILKYHVVAGNYSAASIGKLIADNNGEAKLATVAGGNLIATANNGKVYITDENGNSAEVTIADVNQSNGVIHVVDAVVLPKA